VFRYRIGVMVLFVVACAPPAEGQREAHVSSARQDPLQALAYLLDGAWTASGEIPGFGKYETVRTYERTLGARFIDFHQTSRVGDNTLEVRGIVGLHPETKKVTAWGFSSDGAIAITQCECKSAEEFVFEGRLVGSPQAGPVRGTFRRTAEDRFVETVERQVEGKWRVTFELVFRRADASITEVRATSLDAGVRALAPLEGRWEASGESGGRHYTTEYDFRWAVGGKFLISEYRVKQGGPAELHAVSFIGYHPDEGLMQYGFSADGPVFTAKIKPDAEGRVVFEGEMLAGSQRRRMRISYRRLSDNELETSTEMWRSGAYQSMGTGVMKRVKP